MPKRLSAKEIEIEHEAFKNRLVQEVLGHETGDKVPMEKVVMLIWTFREDPEVVTFMSRFVAKYAGVRHVFDGIEFYLPQLAHMIIHLEVEWDDEILERFALIIAQQSLHFALQLNWILQGALQDYAPEDNEGRPNPGYNRTFYLRCQKLLKNVERCVVYGKPRAQELQRLYEKGKITKQEMIILEQADRRFNALQITAEEDDVGGEQLDGWLYVHMPWKSDEEESTSLASLEYRFCVLERNILNVYKTKNTCNDELVLDRAMMIENAKISDAPKHGIKITTSKYAFKILCSSQEEKTLWMRRLTEESSPSALFSTSMTSVTSNNSSRPNLKRDMTPAQLNRYEFFEDERNFICDIVGVAESLRFEERSERKILAPQKVQDLTIPPNVYLPLCNSSDIWRRVSDKMPKHTRVFNTKERCPVVMHFVAKRGEHMKPKQGLVGSGMGKRMDPMIDVAEYMHNYFDLVAEMGKTDAVQEESESEVQDAAIEEKEVDGGESKNGAKRKDEIEHSAHGSLRSGHSNVWDEDDGSGEENAQPGGNNSSSPTKDGTVKTRGNMQVQRLMRESVVALPTKLAKRMNKTISPGMTRKRSVSVMDRQTEMQPMVPILEGKEYRSQQGIGAGVVAADDDEVSVVSVEASSMLVKDQILLGNLDEGDIDVDCINRATQFISGGESWAGKSASMLETAVEEAEKRDGVKSSADEQLEIVSCMAKSNDDLRQEVFVMQMIHFYKSVFAQAKLPLWLKTYRILSTDNSTGLLELLTDATSLDGLKKAPGYPTEGGLRKYFELVYGSPVSKAFKAAQTNFMQSLAAYAIVSYLLGLKDRHNGNIMIDTRGHLIFIDFGFAFGMKPGHEFSFEKAPFKLTKEYVEVMDGVGSPCYKEFERLFVAGFTEARKNSQIALGLVEIMMYKSNYPCFSGSRYGNGRALIGFEKRLMLRTRDSKVKAKALKLIRKSRRNFGTYLYDVFQKATNGYAI